MGRGLEKGAAQSRGREAGADGIWANRCVRCAARTPLDDVVTGCERCAAEGIRVPVVPTRVGGPVPRRPGPAPAGTGAMWRWRSLLAPVDRPVSLGEGGTPLTELSFPEISARLLLKDERANPTGSFKDRLASAAGPR